MRRQGRVELRGVMVGKGDPITAAPLVGRRGDRALGLTPRFGVGSRFQLDRGAQLIDRGAARQLRVVLIGSLAGPRRDDPDLIQRQPALSQALGAAWELRQPARDGGDRVGVRRRAARLPGHQRRHRPRAGDTAQLVAIDLGDDLNDAPINRVALTAQLRPIPPSEFSAPIPQPKPENNRPTRSDYHESRLVSQVRSGSSPAVGISYQTMAAMSRLPEHTPRTAASTSAAVMICRSSNVTGGCGDSSDPDRSSFGAKSSHSRSAYACAAVLLRCYP